MEPQCRTNEASGHHTALASGATSLRNGSASGSRPPQQSGLSADMHAKQNGCEPHISGIAEAHLSDAEWIQASASLSALRARLSEVLSSNQGADAIAPLIAEP